MSTDAMRILRQLAIVFIVGTVALLGAVTISVAVCWMRNPLAQCLTVGAGVMFLGVAAALTAGARDAQ